MERVSVMEVTVSRAGEAEGGRSPTGASPAGAGRESAGAPNPEVRERAARRRFRAEDKLRILEQADQCLKGGSIGELLRREGIYSSHLKYWRELRAKGILSGLEPAKRGRKPVEKNPLSEKVAQLERENQRLRDRLDKAEIIIEVQKKVSALLGLTGKDREPEEKD